MSKYTRQIEVEAYQIQFTDKDKNVAKKGLPVNSHGTTIRYDEGLFSVLIGTKHAFEGDWVVVEGGQTSIYTDEAFKALFTEKTEPAVAEPAPIEAAPDPADKHPLNVVTEEPKTE